jgi:hypothetical protein
MRNRKYQLHIFLSEYEEKKLHTLAVKTGLSRSTLVRKLISETVPMEQISLDFFAYYRELNAIGNNLNQIAKVANESGHIDSDMYIKCRDEMSELTHRVFEVMMKEKHGYD